MSIEITTKALSTNSSIDFVFSAILERVMSSDLYLCARCASGDLHAWNSSNNFSISSFLPMLSITSKKSGVYDNSYNNSILIILAKLDALLNSELNAIAKIELPKMLSARLLSPLAVSFNLFTAI